MIRHLPERVDADDEVLRAADFVGRDTRRLRLFLADTPVIIGQVRIEERVGDERRQHEVAPLERIAVRQVELLPVVAILQVVTPFDLEDTGPRPKPRRESTFERLSPGLQTIRDFAVILRYQFIEPIPNTEVEEERIGIDRVHAQRGAVGEQPLTFVKVQRDEIGIAVLAEICIARQT